MFVIKGGSATGWQGTAFPNNESIKDFSLNISTGLAARVMQSHTAETGTASDIDQHFISKFGAPVDGRVVLLPLLLKDKVSALLYVDGGTEGGTLDSAALEQVRKRISQALKKDAIIHQYVDEKIIGGMVLRVDDKLIDASVKYQLEAMKRKMLAATPR